MNLFIMDPEEELTGERLLEFIKLHEARLPRYTMLMDMYKGQHAILTQESKPQFKPDNRLVVNFAKYIVDTLNGYFIGQPLKTVHPNPTVADNMKVIAKRNSQNDNNAELAKMCSIYGHAYEFLYQDEESNTRVTYMAPTEGFVIYDNTVAQNPLYGVRVIVDKEGNKYGSVYSTNYEEPYLINDKGELAFESQQPHYYGDVPVIEYIENEERQGAFEGVISLINAYNKALSEKANDVDYFADAYLSILGAELDEEGLQRIRDNRIINMSGDATDGKIIVEFLDKPNADGTQENLIDRLQELIFQTAMVANITDEKFGTASGVSLKYKLQPMENVALMKERKFTAGIMQRFKMMFNIPGNFPVPPESYLDIEYKFYRNIPSNLQEEATIISTLKGIISDETLLSLFSGVDNVQVELERLEKQRSELSGSSFGSFGTETPSTGNDVVDDGRES